MALGTATDERRRNWDAGVIRSLRLALFSAAFQQAALWCAVATSVVMSGRIVVRTAGMALASRFDTPFSDQWDQIPFVAAFLKNSGWLPLLWHQHNEHRIPLYRLLHGIDAAAFHGTGQFLLLVNWGMLLAQVIVLVVLVWGLKNTPVVLRLLATSVAFACTFSSVQIENIVLPMGSTNLGVYLFGATTLLLIARLSERPGRPARWLLPVCTASLASVSLVSGLLVWPIGWLLALSLRASFRVVAGWTTVSAVAIFLYSFDYDHSTTLGFPLANLSQVSLTIDFLLTYFGAPILILGTPKVAAAGIAVLALFTGAIYHHLRMRAAGLIDRPGFSRLLPIAAIGVFVLGAALMTASGRLSLGVAAAQASRYQTPVLLFWSIALILLLAVQLQRNSWSMPARFFRAGLPLLAVFCLMRVEPTGEWALSLAAQIRTTGIAVALGIDDPPAEAFGGVTPERVAWYRPTLQAYQLSMFHRAAQLWLGSKATDHYSQASPETCMGSIDAAVPVQAPAGGRRVSGWAWDKLGRRPASAVLFVDSADRIVGWAETTGLRDDVSALFAVTKRQRIGFGGYVKLDDENSVHAFALDAARNSLCRFGTINP